MKLEYKKQAVDLTDLAIGIIVLGIAVSIGATILITTRDSRLTDLSVYTTNNETITGDNSTGSALTNTWFKGISTVYNATDGTVVGSGNYTTSTDAFGIGTLTIVGADYNGASLNVTYTAYNTSRADYSLANNAAIGVGEFGNWFKIIVITAVAAVVLSLIFMSFGRNSSSSGVSY